MEDIVAATDKSNKLNKEPSNQENNEMEECDQCNQQFSENDHLRTHIVTQHGTNRYNCDECEFCCSNEEEMENHRAVTHEHNEASESITEEGNCTEKETQVDCNLCNSKEKEIELLKVKIDKMEHVEKELRKHLEENELAINNTVKEMDKIHKQKNKVEKDNQKKIKEQKDELQKS